MQNPDKKEVPTNAAVHPDEVFTPLRADLVRRIHEGELPSVSIAAVRDGQIVWCESLGWADKENGIAAAPDTPYGLASLGKSVTATAVMVLVDQGMVDLNAPVSQYIGDGLLTVYEGAPDQVTVRRVLNMTAAIPHGGMVFKRQSDAAHYSTDKLLRNRGIVVFPPGEVNLYSNFAYAVLEKLIEAVSGKSYPQFLQSAVFGPLGMMDSFCLLGDEGEWAEPAAPYDEKNERFERRYMLPLNSLGLYASLNDLLNFGLFQLQSQQFKGQRLFGEAQLGLMHHLRAEVSRPVMALGIASIDLGDGLLWLLTNGRAGGMQATLSMAPSEGAGAICLVNATGGAADDIAFGITEMLVPGFMARAGRVIEGYESWANRPYEPAAEILGEWEGYVETGQDRIPIQLDFQPDGAVHARIGEDETAALGDFGYRDGFLSGDLRAVLPVEEAQADPHQVTISVRLTGDMLSGFATAEITNQKGHFTLASYVRLSRVSE